MYSRFLKKYYKNLNLISEVTHDVFLCEEILEKLVMNMNYTIKVLNEKETSQKYKIKNM